MSGIRLDAHRLAQLDEGLNQISQGDLTTILLFVDPGCVQGRPHGRPFALDQHPGAPHTAEEQLDRFDPYAGIGLRSPCFQSLDHPVAGAILQVGIVIDRIEVDDLTGGEVEDNQLATLGGTAETGKKHENYCPLIS